MPQIDALPDDENGAPITRRFISHAILYLQDSPAGMFLCWAIGSNSTRKPSGIDSQQTEHDQQNASTKAFEGMCYEVDKTDGPSPCFPTYKMHLANRQCEQGAQSWPLPKRVLVASIICLYTFIVYAASAVYIIGLRDTMVEFKISNQQSLLGLSLYVLAYGLGPMIWAPLSEEAYIGRSMIYALTFVVFVCLSVLAATVTSWHSFLAVRFFQAFFGSPCLAIGGASMHDLFPNSSVPYSLVFWIAAAYCGPALGPLIASYLIPERGWRWGMWEVAWLAIPTLVLMLTLPETQQSTLIARKVKPDMASSQSEASRTAGSIARDIIKSLGDTIVRPLQIASLDPAVAVANFYIAFMYGTYYTFFDAMPRVYLQRYAFTVEHLGLTFISIFVACTIGGATYSVYIWRLSRRTQQRWLDEPEICLRPAIFASLLPPIGLFIFGWTSNGQIAWIISLIGVVVYAVGVFIILECMSVYLPRIYPEYAASLFAANDFCRSILAAIAVHLSVPLYNRLGVATGVSILGALSVLGIPGMWLIYKKGATLRAKSRFVVRDMGLN